MDKTREDIIYRIKNHFRGKIIKEYKTYIFFQWKGTFTTYCAIVNTKNNKIYAWMKGGDETILYYSENFFVIDWKYIRGFQKENLTGLKNILNEIRFVLL